MRGKSGGVVCVCARAHAHLRTAAQAFCGGTWREGDQSCSGQQREWGKLFPAVLLGISPRDLPMGLWDLPSGRHPPPKHTGPWAHSDPWVLSTHLLYHLPSFVVTGLSQL